MFSSNFKDLEVALLVQKDNQILFFQKDFKFMLNFNLHKICLTFNFLQLFIGIFANYV